MRSFLLPFGKFRAQFGVESSGRRKKTRFCRDRERERERERIVQQPVLLAAGSAAATATTTIAAPCSAERDRLNFLRFARRRREENVAYRSTQAGRLADGPTGRPTGWLAGWQAWRPDERAAGEQAPIVEEKHSRCHLLPALPRISFGFPSSDVSLSVALVPLANIL